MPTDLTFREICEALKAVDGKLLEAADKLMSAAMLLSPLAIGPAALPVLGLLKAKEEVVRLGHSLLKAITSRKTSDYLSRSANLQAAYGLICVTAFFEAFDRLAPSDLRDGIELLPQEKARLAGAHKARQPGREKDHSAGEAKGRGVLDTPLPFPHPVLTFAEQMAHLEPIYKSMTNGLGELLKSLAVWEDADERGKASIRTMLEELPKLSLDCFEAQYFELARVFPDFFIWSRLHEQKGLGAKLKGISKHVRQHALLLAEGEKRIDVGFSRLHKLVLGIPDHFQKVEAENIVEGLRRHYERMVQAPIIEDEYKPEEGKPALEFPKISQAFVPQSYRVLRQTTRDKHFEKEETWNELTPRHDLGAFLLSYLSSPYSIETPLLILGHPGSGKSLLTKVLAATILSESFTPIRVPLRDVDVDSPPENQIEMEVARATGAKITSWASFSSQFADRPLVVILDGYDELLQASGQVFAGYLKVIQKFQEREAVQHRPVRVIVTSRVALIDKVAVPPGSTVIRLLEFTERQRAMWIKIWNDANVAYFAACHPTVDPFELPKTGKDGKQDKILSLASQPLLLLMLALYDSENNRLREHKTLDRTALYDSLLRRFVERERRRYVQDFDTLPEARRHDEVDREMSRLGVAAIGMYNRRQFHIRSSELGRDLVFFDLERRMRVEGGRPAPESDLLLGSFFFIHKSKAGEKGEAEERKEGDTAYEFLHNTFGEFLTADFVLRFAFQETEGLFALRGSDALRAKLDKTLQDPNGLAKEWFACLAYAPLFSRPEVLQMLREWWGHLLQRRQRARKDFLDCLDDILHSQIGMILRARNLPPMLSTDEATHFADLPMLGHAAIYTVNLITLRAVLDPGDFVFDESSYNQPTERTDSGTRGTRPWDMLAHLWRSWFPVDTLSGLTAVFSGRREGSKICLTAREAFQVSASQNRLETILNVASALADNTTGGLATLLARHSAASESECLGQAQQRLESESIRLDLEFATRRLLLLLSGDGEHGEPDGELVTKGLHQCFEGGHRNSLVTEFLYLLREVVHRRLVSLDFEMRLAHDLLGPRSLHPMRLMELGPGVGMAWVRLVRELGGVRHWWGLGREFAGEYFGRAMHPQFIMEMLERRPEVAVDWIRLVNEWGGGQWLARVCKEVGDDFYLKAMQPDFLGRMMKARPDLAVEWIRLVAELGGGPWVEHFKKDYGEELVRRAMPPTQLVQLLETRPDLAVEWSRLARELSGTRWIERFRKEVGREFFARVMHPGRFMEMVEMRPDVAIASIRLLRELGGGPWLERFGNEFGEEFVSRALHPGRFRELSELRPAVAVEWIRLVREVGGESWADRISRLLTDGIVGRAFPRGRFREMLESRPDVAVEWIRLLRESGDDRSIERLGKELLSAPIRPDFSGVRMEFLRDIRWFADATHNESLLQAVLPRH